MFDSFGRNIHYLRVSVTDRCNLRCTYCMPEEGVPFVPHERILSLEQIALVVGAAAGLGFDKVRLTGGEPLVRKGLPQLVSMISGIPGIVTIGMTTNGTLLAPVAAELRRRGLSSVNVSLDTLDPERYALVTRGGDVRDAVAGIRAARLAGFPVKLNVVVDSTASGG
ncbi:MAG: radical SAM protein, partial [Spirochaetae bacterium HGW-Spirochaetae-7]